MSRVKYSREIIESAVRDSLSYAEVLRRLGLKQTGGSHSNIKRWVRRYELDTAHFLGKHRVHVMGRNAHNKLHHSTLLVKGRYSVRVEAKRLRKAMIEAGFDYSCSICGNKGEWQGKEMTLEVDHINRDFTDNSPGNVRFMCPNCHSQV